MNGCAVRNPIVLVHGILGFNDIPLTTVSYFRDIANVLGQNDLNTVCAPQLSPLGSIQQRAQELKSYLSTEPGIAGRHVHLFAHSLGGLDARYMISRLGMQAKVLSLTTIGTPHLGTPVADVGIGLLQDTIRPLLTLGVSLAAIFDLTTDFCAEFNSQTPDAPGVRHFSVAGDYTPGSLDLLRWPYDIIINSAHEANDGLVSVQSARHGTFLGTWEGNHFRLINWATNVLEPVSELNSPDIPQKYLDLLRNLLAHNF